MILPTPEGSARPHSRSDHGAQLLWVCNGSESQERLPRFLAEGGYQVALAPTSREACRALAEELPDLVILDLQPPELEALEVCRFLHSLPGGEDVPVLAILAPGSPGGPSPAMRAGADDFLHRPLPPGELQSRVRNLNRMRLLRLELRRDLEALLTLKAQKEGLVQFVVHDLKNLLGTLVTNLELLEHHPERAARYCAQIGGTTRNMLAMVQNMLDLSVQEEGVLVPRPSRLPAGKWLQWLRADLEAQVLRRNQTLVLAVDPDLELEADLQLLQRAVVNLLGNACKYGPEGSRIEFAIRRREAAVRIEVSDQGPGIPAAQKQRVFDRFARLDPEGAPYAGHGLGLAFCHLVAKLHGGAIWVEDNQPRGSRFILEIPHR